MPTRDLESGAEHSTGRSSAANTSVVMHGENKNKPGRLEGPLPHDFSKLRCQSLDMSMDDQEKAP